MNQIDNWYSLVSSKSTLVRIGLHNELANLPEIHMIQIPFINKAWGWILRNHLKIFSIICKNFRYGDLTITFILINNKTRNNGKYFCNYPYLSKG